MNEDETVTFGLSLDASAAIGVLDDLERRSQGFGAALTGALKSATLGGKGLEDTLKAVGERLAGVALSAGLKPLDTLVSSLTAGLANGLGSLFAFADGGVPGRVTPFAAGGVVSAPTYFPMGGDFGLMGEAGTEAVLPLKRGADGTLGVSGGGGTTQIVFNVTASDAESFRKSEGQVTAMLARSVARGRRNL